MKKQFALVAALVLQSSLALASTPPEAVPGIDAAREGNLASKAAEFYEKSGIKGCEDDYGKATFAAHKLASGSSLDEKTADSTLTYEATYLVTSRCNTGSTYSGAYVEVTNAAIVKAERFGRRDAKGAVVPEKPDTFTIVRTIDVSTLN